MGSVGVVAYCVCCACHALPLLWLRSCM